MFRSGLLINLRHNSSYRRSRRPGGFGSDQGDKWKILLLIIPGSTFCLGTWQIHRLQVKKELIEELKKKTTKPPIELPADIKDKASEMEYRRVLLHGEFDHNRELLLVNRSQMNESFSIKGTGGVQVITPFKCKETGSYILVNRGWVPRDRSDARTRQRGQVEGEVEITGIIRTGEQQGHLPTNLPEKNQWFWKDTEGMAEYAGTEPVIIDADGTTTVPGGPIGGQTRVSLRNDHLQYIFTWYTLSIATGYMFYRFWKRRA